MKIKENALKDYEEMIKKSWTYEKMTKEEKERLHNLLYHNTTINSLKGTYNQRWEILHSVYYAYLIGLGYNPTWREKEETPKF